MSFLKLLHESEIYRHQYNSRNNNNHRQPRSDIELILHEKTPGQSQQTQLTKTVILLSEEVCPGSSV